MKEGLAFGGIGSCRIHTPLSILADAEKIQFRTDKVIGYLHNPLEIIQSIDLLKGDLNAPIQLAELMNINAPERLGSEDRFAKLFTNVDALVIEISSIRIIEYRGWQLQINRVREHLKPFGLYERQLGYLFREDCDRSIIINSLCGEVPEFVIDLMKEGKFYELQGLELISALINLRKKVPMPVIFIGLVSCDFQNNPIPQRAKIRAGLRWLADDCSETFFIDPTEFVVRHDIRASMFDLGHYEPEFEATVANHFYDEIVRIANISNEVNRRAARRRQRDLNRAALNR